MSAGGSRSTIWRMASGLPIWTYWIGRSPVFVCNRIRDPRAEVDSPLSKCISALRLLGNDVRPWLVVVGIVFLTLAAGTLATLYFAGAGNPTVTSVATPYPTFALWANETLILPFSGPNGSAEQFSLAWHASSRIGLVLEAQRSCVATCVPSRVLANWSSNTSGNWRGAGPFPYPLLCVLRNLQSHLTNVTLTGRAVATNPTRLSWMFEVVVGAGGVGLVVVGGISLFIGLFLRGDPYGPDPPLVSRSADDAEALAREPPPAH